MSAGWNGATPTPFSDGAGIDYELCTKYHANGDVTLSHIRAWGGVTSTAFPARKGRVWSAAGASLGVATLPDQLLPGWNLYALGTPIIITSGTDFWVSSNVMDTYGFVAAPGYPALSADGLLTATSGGLNNTPSTFPNTSTSGFYGIDVEYLAGTAGNQRPVVGIGVGTNGLTATATLTVVDEAPNTVSYVLEWGDGTTSAVSGLGPHTHVYATAGTYAVLVTATDSGGLTDSAAVVVAVTAASATALPYTLPSMLEPQRGITAAYIASDPTQVVLIPHTLGKSPTGGQIGEDGPPRPAQTFKLTPMTSNQKPTVTLNGKERLVDYTLVGVWDSVVAIGDWWGDKAGRWFEVIAMAPGHGYEIKALVEAHG